MVFEDDDEIESPCSTGRFTVLYAEFHDGGRIAIDSVDSSQPMTVDQKADPVFTLPTD